MQINLYLFLERLVNKNDYRYPARDLFECIGSVTIPYGHPLSLHFSKQP